MKLLAVLLSLVLLGVMCPLPVQAEEEAPPELLIEANTGCILSEVNAEAPCDPGSLAKLMTAYLTALAVEEARLTPETVLTAGESVTGMPGAVIWLEPGDRITVDELPDLDDEFVKDVSEFDTLDELLTALLVGNANDAAAVLADAVSGDASAFVMDMNAAAFDLGMRETRFTSPQGFDDPAARSTARDLGKLACAVLRCPLLTPYLTTWRTFVKDGAAEVVNENTLTRTLDGCRGLKAAHSGGRYSLIAAAEQDGMCLAAVVLDCTDADARFTRARALLREGFAGWKLSAPGYAEEFLVPLRIRGGTEQAVLLRLSELPVLAVPKSAQITSVTVLPQFVQAPVRAGGQVGTVYFYCGDTFLTEAALLAAEDVPALRLPSALRKAAEAVF